MTMEDIRRDADAVAVATLRKERNGLLAERDAARASNELLRATSALDEKRIADLEAELAEARSYVEEEGERSAAQAKLCIGAQAENERLRAVLEAARKALGTGYVCAHNGCGGMPVALDDARALRDAIAAVEGE